MKASSLVVGKQQAKRSKVGSGRSQGEILSLRPFRAKIRKEREIDTVGEALRLRGKLPEESIEIMFDMAEFVEDLTKAVEDA